MDLVLRKTGSKKPERAYVLAVRDFGSGVEVDWTYLCYMDECSAHSLAETNKPYFWEGEPEEGIEAKELRLGNPALREAWDNYKILKTLLSPNK